MKFGNEVRSQKVLRRPVQKNRAPGKEENGNQGVLVSLCLFHAPPESLSPWKLNQIAAPNPQVNSAPTMIRKHSSQEHAKLQRRSLEMRKESGLQILKRNALRMRANI